MAKERHNLQQALDTLYGGIRTAVNAQDTDKKELRGDLRAFANIFSTVSRINDVQGDLGTSMKTILRLFLNGDLDSVEDADTIEEMRKDLKAVATELGGKTRAQKILAIE